VAPGMVDTQMLRANNKPEALNAMIERNVLRRVGKADEIAAESDLASGSWSKSFIAEHEQNDFVYDPNLLRTERCTGRFWESTCSNIIEAAATSASD